jgi:hypothetical protein
MTREVTRDFAAASRMPDVDHILQVQMSGNRGEVIGVMIHIVAVGNLGGAAMASPIVGDHAIAVIQKKQHLIVPIIGGQRPSVAEDDGLA